MGEGSITESALSICSHPSQEGSSGGRKYSEETFHLGLNTARTKWGSRSKQEEAEQKEILLYILIACFTFDHHSQWCFPRVREDGKQ